MSVSMTSYRLKSLVACPVDKSDGEPCPFVGLEDIGSGTGSLLADHLPTKAALDSLLHRPGDVLFSKLRPYLAKSFMPKAPGTGTGELLVLRPQGLIDKRFLLYSTLSSPWLEWAETTSYGSKMPRTSWEAMAEYRLALPTLDEQRSITEFLDAETARIDGLTAARQRMRDVLILKRERMAEQILGLDSGPTMIPLKYEVQSVSVGIVITPANWYVDSGGVIALRGLNVSPGHIDTSDIVQISHTGHRENMKSRLSAGDVVVVRTGQAGAAAVVPKELDGCNCIDLLIIRPGRSTSSSFLAHYLNSFYARDKITEYSVGSIQSHFNVGSMKNLGFPLIEPKEQERRASALDEAAGDLNLLDLQLETQLAVLGERRQALITAAVTGQIDVTTARGLAPDGGRTV
jgi:type I restriction enzyme S subunit